MKDLHSHSASPRQLDSIINQNQIIQLPARPPIPLSACPYVRLSVHLSTRLTTWKKNNNNKKSAPLVFP